MAAAWPRQPASCTQPCGTLSRECECGLELGTCQKKAELPECAFCLLTLALLVFFSEGDCHAVSCPKTAPQKEQRWSQSTAPCNQETFAQQAVKSRLLLACLSELRGPPRGARQHPHPHGQGTQGPQSAPRLRNCGIIGVLL